MFIMKAAEIEAMTDGKRNSQHTYVLGFGWKLENLKHISPGWALVSQIVRIFNRLNVCESV